MKVKLALVVASATALVVACAATETTPPPVDGDAGPGTLVPGTEEPGTDEPKPERDAGSRGDSGSGGVDTAVCGDGTKAGGEECDDGNNADGDGCSKDCKVESAGPNDVCPGVAIPLTGTGADMRRGSVSGSTSAIFGQTAGSCGGASGKDAVYSVTPDVTGLLTATVTSTFDSILYARRTCDDTKTEAACNDAAGSTGGETIKIPVTKDQPVFLFVDGYSGSTGTFKLDIEVATSFCGNGVAESPEACDDGNTLAGDGCAPDCSLEAGGVLTDCPGQGIFLTGVGDAPRKISLAGSTSVATSSTQTASGCTASGRNTVYAITPDVNGSIVASLVATYDDAVIHLRSECDNSTSQLTCFRANEPLETIEVVAPVEAGFPTYVIVDSYLSTLHGPYILDVTVNPAVCGNRILDGGEECDDGNTLSGDGCTAGCKLEPVNMAADTCPGVGIPLTAAADGSYSGVISSATVSMAHDFKPKTAQGGCSTTNTLAKDAVYEVVSPVNGTLRGTVSALFDSMLLVRDLCSNDVDASAYTDLACAGNGGGGVPETVELNVTANQRMWLIVDSEVAGGEGPFELGVTFTPAVCGNGVIEGGEQCDDGGAVSGDGCNAQCQLEPVTGHDTCANAAPIDLVAHGDGSYSATISSGTTNLAHDQTFTGCASAGADAIYTFKAPIDGVLAAEVPVAGFNVSLGLRSTCPTSTTGTAPLVCANASSDNGQEEISHGVTKDTTYYLIVDGTAAAQKGTFTLLVNVRPPGCGDGLLSGNEQCDDGNTLSGDGCSPTCTVEALAGIDTCPGYTLNLTGTGNEPRVGVLTVDTSTLAANYAASCGGSSRDGVVVVTPPISGKLTARLTGSNTYQPVLYGRATCGDAASELKVSTSTTTLACDDDAPSFGTNIRETNFKVTAGTPYYIFIDGYGMMSGIGRLNVTVTP